MVFGVVVSVQWVVGVVVLGLLSSVGVDGVVVVCIVYFGVGLWCVVVGVGVGGGVGGVVAIGVDWDRDVFELVCVAMIGAWFVVGGSFSGIGV